MIVIDPNDTTHNITITPRYYNANANTFKITDEDTRLESTLVNSKSISNGQATYTVDITTSEGKSYSVKIEDGSLVVWRGKIFVTEQTTQIYKING